MYVKSRYLLEILGQMQILLRQRCTKWCQIFIIHNSYGENNTKSTRMSNQKIPVVPNPIFRSRTPINIMWSLMGIRDREMNCPRIVQNKTGGPMYLSVKSWNSWTHSIKILVHRSRARGTKLSDYWQKAQLPQFLGWYQWDKVLCRGKSERWRVLLTPRTPMNIGRFQRIQL